MLIIFNYVERTLARKNAPVFSGLILQRIINIKTLLNKIWSRFIDKYNCVWRNADWLASWHISTKIYQWQWKCGCSLTSCPWHHSVWMQFKVMSRTTSSQNYSLQKIRLIEWYVAFSNHKYNICKKRCHDYEFCAIHTCYYYGSFSYVVKIRNLTPFILKLMTECQS